MTLEKIRVRDLQEVDQRGLTYKDGRFYLGGEHVDPIDYE